MYMSTFLLFYSFLKSMPEPHKQEFKTEMGGVLMYVLQWHCFPLYWISLLISEGFFPKKMIVPGDHPSWVIYHKWNRSKWPQWIQICKKYKRLKWLESRYFGVGIWNCTQLELNLIYVTTMEWCIHCSNQ
jgi:hypothetical protein